MKYTVLYDENGGNIKKLVYEEENDKDALLRVVHQILGLGYIGDEGWEEEADEEVSTEEIKNDLSSYTYNELLDLLKNQHEYPFKRFVYLISAESQDDKVDRILFKAD